MKLIDLSMKNFMPYRGLQRLSFPEDPQRNVMVVLGDNMRGKTSLLNANPVVLLRRRLRPASRRDSLAAPGQR